LRLTNNVINRDSDSVDRYLLEISKQRLLTAQEEAALARQIREGDMDALDTLVKANLRFVVSVAKQYQNQGLSVNDLINEGNLGLIRAAQKFDETKGFKFISYGVWWIRQAMAQAIIERSKDHTHTYGQSTALLQDQPRFPNAGAGVSAGPVYRGGNEKDRPHRRRYQ
jgi:RNA polymerase primary sigma factor